MKTLRIYKREILERTQFRDWRYKQVTEYIIQYDGREVKNCDTKLDNPKLRIPFENIFSSRSAVELNKFISNLSRCQCDIWLKDSLKNLLEAR